MNAALVQQLVAIGGSVTTTLLAAWAKNHYEGKRSRRRLRRATRAAKRTTPDRATSQQNGD
jgi:hypothetical protein